MHFFPLGIRARGPQEALRGGAAWMGPAWPTLDTNTQGTASALHPQAF